MQMVPSMIRTKLVPLCLNQKKSYSAIRKQCVLSCNNVYLTLSIGSLDPWFDSPELSALLQYFVGIVVFKCIVKLS